MEKSSFLTLLDIFGHSFIFNFRGKKKLKTIAGASLSLVFFATFLAYCVNAIRSISKTSDPLIKSTTLKAVGTEGFSIDEDSPFLPVFYVADLSSNDPVLMKNPSSTDDLSILNITQYISNPLSHFIFYASVDTITSEQGSTTSKTESLMIPVIMCRDLKKKKGSHYYLDKILMPDTERELIESSGVCLDMPKLKFDLIFSNGITRMLRFDVYNCAGQDGCVPLSEVNDNLIVFCRASRAYVNLKEYESPVTYRLDTRINNFGINKLLAHFNDSIFYIDIQSIENILNEHDFLDTVKSVAQYIYYQEKTIKYIKKFVNKIDPSYDYGWLKCDGYDDWRVYTEADYKSGTNCKRQNKYICPWTGFKMKEKCPSFFGVQMKMDLEVSKTEHQREYAKVLRILGEIGGFFGLLSGVFSALNEIILLLIQKNLVTATFFPLLFPNPKSVKEKVQKKNQSKVKGEAVEFIKDCLDINNIIREVSFIRHLSALLLSPAAQHLLLLSSFAEFRKQKIESEAYQKPKELSEKPARSKKLQVTPLDAWPQDAENEASLKQKDWPNSKKQNSAVGTTFTAEEALQPKLALRDSLEVLIRKNIKGSEFELTDDLSKDLSYLDVGRHEGSKIKLTKMVNKEDRSKFVMKDSKPLANKNLAPKKNENEDIFANKSGEQ